VIVAHIMGLPIEESVVQLALGGTGLAATTVMASEGIRRVLRAVRRRVPRASD
jgi:hypothetical protein